MTGFFLSLPFKGNRCLSVCLSEMRRISFLSVSVCLSVCLYVCMYVCPSVFSKHFFPSLFISFSMLKLHYIVTMWHTNHSHVPRPSPPFLGALIFSFHFSLSLSLPCNIGESSQVVGLPTLLLALLHPPRLELPGDIGHHYTAQAAGAVSPL